MGLFDKVKKEFESKKEDGESQNGDGSIVHVEKAEGTDFVQRTQGQEIEPSSNRNILFVCKTNATISPMAEAIFNQFSGDRQAFSAGSNALSGIMASQDAIRVCQEHGIELSHHLTANINDFSLDDVGLILTSSAQIRDGLKMKFPDARIFTIREYAGGYLNPDIFDPFNEGFARHKACFIEVNEAVIKILRRDMGVQDEIVERPLATGDENIVGKPVKINDFKYLDDLIHSGAKEIVLDSDIVLSDSEESEYEGGIKLDVDDLTIDGNGHTIDAQGKARIFCCTGKNINVKNIVLKNGLAQKFGGAIYNHYGELTIAESSFSQNAVGGYGGAVYNSGELTIRKSALNANTARTLGGAIYNNSDGRLTIAESLLRENTSDFKAGALYNSGTLILTGSSLKGNCAQRYGGAIVNVGANIRIEETSFANNESQFPLRSICNDEGGRLKLLEVHFDGDAIVNHGRLAVMGKFSASQSKAIFNRGYAVIESEDVCKSIENTGIVDKLESPTENQRDFTYLNELICSGTDEISLKHDILLNIRKDVNETFCDGIEIDRNDLTIDGNGHSIDALGFTRIFCCTGKNITLKNITLKNGFAPKDGAAVYNEGELTVCKSGLSANTALYDGGAIYNGGELTVSESEFSQNTSNHNGGAIHNRGELTVCKSYLSQNSAKRKGGAVFNYRAEMTLIQSELAANTALSGGGAIYNYECKSGIAESRICENTSQRHGGAIFNENGELAITESALNKNGAMGKYGRGGAIYSLGKLALERCELAENTARRDGGAIHNSEGEITIAGSSLTRNATKSNGGAVYNDSGMLSIAESGICENTAQGDGGAIDNWGSLAIEDCALKANTAQNGSGGAIYAIFGELSIKDSAFA